MNLKGKINEFKTLHTLSEEELSAKLTKTLVIQFIIIGVLGFSLLFFAPKIGYFFGLLSRHRNEKDKAPLIIPNPPVFTNLPKSTNQSNLTLKGYAAAGSTIKIFVNGPQKGEGLTGADGVFEIGNIPLNSGRNTLNAKLTTSDGIESDKTQSYTIVLDTQKPSVKLKNLKDGDTVRNLDKRIIIEGSVNEKATIKINNRSVIVKPDLTFEFNMGVNEGEVEIKIEAIDEAGNKKEEKLKVKYEKKSF